MEKSEHSFNLIYYMKKLFLFYLSCSWCVGLMAQSELPQVSDTYAITNAFITPSAGTTSYYGTIVMTDGIITSVGPSVNIPFSAQVIDVDSAHVYPAFIATLSHAGIRNTDDDERVDVDRPGYPPNDVAGITPEKSMSSEFSPSDNSVKGLREAGFAIAHSVPKKGMLPGMGSVISLSGNDFDQSVLVEDMSVYAKFEGASRVFPATTIGVMAKFRELYKNAEIGAKYQKSYAQNPLNKKRGGQDAATKALYGTTDGSMSIYFQTESTLDVSRALTLQKELGFNICLSEVKSAPQVQSILKTNPQPVLFSLDLPDEDDSEDEEMTDEQKALLNKKKESIKAACSQAAQFAESNQPFAFSYVDVKTKDIHSQVKRLIDHGLSFDDALSALTIDAARALNIDKIAGTITNGKAANLIVTTDTLFKEKTQISKVFIDGELFEQKIKEKKKSANSGEEVDFSGSYSYSIDIPGMSPEGKMTFVKSGDTYEVSITSNQAPGESFEASDVEVDGNNVTFDFTIDNGGFTIAVSNDITLEDDSLEGTVSIPDFGSFELTGEKLDSPE